MVKKSVTLRLDEELLAWFRSQGPGYQKAMHSALRLHQKLQNQGNSMPVQRAKSGKIKGPHVESPEFDLEGFVEVPSASGRKLVTMRDVQQGDIRLEEIDCPLFDSQLQTNPYSLPKGRRAEALEKPMPIMFFQSGTAGRSCAYTNLYTAGQLSWPKRFKASGMDFIFSDLIDLKGLVASFQVGETQQKVIPLLNMKITEDRQRKMVTCSTPTWDPIVYIPAVQHFRVELDTGEQYLGDTEVRCTLRGTLFREVH